LDGLISLSAADTPRGRGRVPAKCAPNRAGISRSACCNAWLEDRPPFINHEGAIINPAGLSFTLAGFTDTIKAFERPMRQEVCN
jgi:hypothetical protein